MIDFNISPFVESTDFLIVAWIMMAIIFSVALTVGNRVKYVIVPLLFALISFTIILTVDVLGRPVSTIPKGEFLIIHFDVDINKKDGKTILLWAKIEDKNRLYRIPFSEKRMKQLIESRKRRTKTGQAQMGKFAGRPGFTNQPGELRTYNFPYRERLQKDGN